MNELIIKGLCEFPLQVMTMEKERMVKRPKRKFLAQWTMSCMD